MGFILLKNYSLPIEHENVACQYFPKQVKISNYSELTNNMTSNVLRYDMIQSSLVFCEMKLKIANETFCKKTSHLLVWNC